jgi:hypothetical protein
MVTDAEQSPTSARPVHEAVVYSHTLCIAGRAREPSAMPSSERTASFSAAGMRVECHGVLHDVNLRI